MERAHNRGGDFADEALMRRLAARYAPRGTARLGLERSALRRLASALDEAACVRRSGRASGAALALLDGQAPVIEACARRAAREGGVRLSAWRGVPRIETAMAVLCAGDGALTRQRLLDAVAELDALQELTQAELWAVPEALRVALSRALLRSAFAVLRRAECSARARRWVRRPTGGGVCRDAAFLAQALKCAEEEGNPLARRLLDAHLNRRALSAEAVVARAQAEEAAELLRLENLLAARRMIDALNWQVCFRQLSRVERELCRDAAGVYPRMDEASRQAVRREVAHIAARLKLPELAVARTAADAAREADAARGGKGIRSNVCWWLYGDEGRRALLSRLGRRGRPIRKMVPDPAGRVTVAAILALAAALTALLGLWAGVPWLWPACALLGWRAAGQVIGRFYSRFFPPARLLELELKAVPEDCRTLVTMPALLSSPRRAEAICASLEALGCLETDENIEYLLLGDFADAPQRHMPGDGPILERARACIDAMNARAGREKYALLCRERTLLPPDGLWMGRDRKRGALMDLNRLLLGREGAETAFAAEGRACGRLRGRFNYVVTLDVDTRALPDDLRRLIGAMAHPLNRPDGRRGYAVLQPRMETLPSACVNGFVRLFAGPGGVNAYPVSVSNLWQDLTGRGIYGGKGIYDVAAFQARVEDALPEGRVLSHDLVEGALAGAGFIGSLPLYDGHPATLAACLDRRHRWTRGDWQLLPLLFSLRTAANAPCASGSSAALESEGFARAGRACLRQWRDCSIGNRIGGADRFRILDNLVRSLWPPALLVLIVGGAWTGSAGALGAALVLAWLELLLHLGGGDGLKWRRAVAELALLPLYAFTALDAVGRTLWRLFASGRKLLQWVTAADSEARTDRGRISRWPGRLAALLLVPGLAGGCGMAALALGLLFLIGPGWVEDMQREAVGGPEPLSAGERDLFMDLARRTWRFFEDNMPPEGSPLPPDNVQLDPPVGAARRTSPTNIALYLLSCLSARRLGFIDVAGMRRRMAATLHALENMEKWRGQLYNWYDIDTLAPLKPRYVSSVDSGNLAAALLLCANAPEAGEALAPRLRALAEGMDLAALYDDERELFAIGMDVESGRVSSSHYDLLASEARILSFTAMMLGQAPARHWQRLGRACAGVGGGVAPLSWNGTMFEYLMPLLFMAAPPLTLLGEGVPAAVRAQIEQGRRLNRPWGVSESGYCALDAAMNYQYRAFGLRALALDGEAADGVVAPYASALAAMVAPKEAARNLRRMAEMGWSGRWGMFEAADYLRPEPGGGPAIVHSHMAHHQGMALCALCNALTGGSLRSDFMGLPQARALSLLLEERACPAGPRRPGRRAVRMPEAPRDRFGRWCDPRAQTPQTHLLRGGDLTALCTDDGAIHCWREDLLVTRFEGVLQDRRDAARIYLIDEAAGGHVPLAGPARFEPGRAQYLARLNRLKARMDVGLSPEDGTLICAVDVHNGGGTAARCAAACVFPLALCSRADWRAHAVFQNLFVESSRPAPDALLFQRRPGSRGADGPRLAVLAAGPGEISWETDYEKLAGRTGDAGKYDAIDRPLSGGLGATLNPAAALRVAVDLAPGQSAQVCFMLRLMNAGEPVSDWLECWRRPEQARRALRLAGIRAGALLDFVGLDSEEHHSLQRLAALLVDGIIAAQARGPRRGEEGIARAALWPMGLSGDRPMLMMAVSRASDAQPVRALIRAHGFYRAMGLLTDLVLLDDGEAGYARPVRDMLENLISASHLNRLRCAAGGVWRIDGARLDGDSRRALARFASAAFAAERDFHAQARALLSAASGPRGARLRDMDAGKCLLKPQDRLRDNGFGGFLPEGGYAIDLVPGRLPPAPWCNLLANDAGGMLLSDRGGGWFWHGNSRNGRLTPYGNDTLCEGWGLMLYLVDGARGEMLRLLPGARPQVPFRIVHDSRATRYTIDADRLGAEVRMSMHPDRAEAQIAVRIENRGLRTGGLRLEGHVAWLMGADAGDAVALNAWYEDGACFATGATEGVGWFAASGALTRRGPCRRAFLGRGDISDPEGLDATGGEGWALSVPLSLKRGESAALRLVVGWAESVAAARERVRVWRLEPDPQPEERLAALTIDTPDAALNALANGFLLHQVRASRVLGRAGLYQPGGAWGFRDQLQDMLALLHDEPERVRRHLLRCAAHQFEAGDVMHWWHEPFTGVRTRISDDLLFLPWAAAAYVEHTGDIGVLFERVAYLNNVDIPADSADFCGAMQPGALTENLHGHCMRAFRRACRRGKHGLLLMGAGDWNDGMNRVGAKGKGESVWLTQFAIACADRYRRVAPDEEDRVWLWRQAETLRQAVEAHGWDGRWYLRAYCDDGAPLGGSACGECRIDAISQAWAVLSGLDGARCRMAIDAAWEMLADEGAGIVRLLTPAFDGHGPDPGYIRGYPPGVRENGGQYTHGALWLLLALIRMGDEERAHAALDMLLPFNHSDSPEKAEIYRVEPYVMAADVYDRPGMAGRGGWTWYTGSAGWMYSALLALLGYERRGDAVRLNALLGDWPRAAVTVRFGESRYRLVCDREADHVTLDGAPVPDDFISMVDDGQTHEARFPARRPFTLSAAAP